MSQPTDRYLDVEMPERFVLQFRTNGDEWMDEASCREEEFERLEDGSYVSTPGGSIVWIRCVEHLDDGLVHVDGGGEDRFVYRLVPLPED